MLSDDELFVDVDEDEGQKLYQYTNSGPWAWQTVLSVTTSRNGTNPSLFNLLGLPDLSSLSHMYSSLSIEKVGEKHLTRDKLTSN